MNHAFGTIGLAVAAFASTNLDDLQLLATLFVDAEFSSHSIIVGQFIGMAVLVGLSAVGALPAVIIPDRWLALLGLAPFLLGVHRFWKLWRGREPKQGTKDFLWAQAASLAEAPFRMVDRYDPHYRQRRR